MTASSNTTGCPLVLRRHLAQLAQGGPVDRGVNVLAFGLAGTGESQARCAVGHRLVEAGHSVLFAPAYRLVQELLPARRNLDPPQRLRGLDHNDYPIPVDWAASPRGPGSQGCSSPSSANPTSEGPWASLPTLSLR